MLVGAATAALAPVAAAGPPSPAQRLVRAYSPIVMLREQLDPPCDGTEEQYEPTTVEVMLGNPRVRLLGPLRSSGRGAIKRAPSVADVAGRGPDHYLDLPGDAVNPGCRYARDFRALKAAGRAPPITYARVVREPGVAGLVVQYWFFYYFNQFNDVHEGDWEGMQVAFDASTPQQALAKGPSEIALFQHAGGEKAGWDDGKVEKEGTHLVVYPAAGSHATFFESAVVVENGQGGSGLGCDNTSKPLRRVQLQPVLVPTRPAPEGPFGWLTYLGHWGERQKGFNNGPTGPITKEQWLEPSAAGNAAAQRRSCSTCASVRPAAGSVVISSVGPGRCAAQRTAAVVQVIVDPGERAVGPRPGVDGAELPVVDANSRIQGDMWQRIG